MKVRVIKDGRRYYVTYDAPPAPRKFKGYYRRTAACAEVFRFLKQRFGWGGASRLMPAPASLARSRYEQPDTRTSPVPGVFGAGPVEEPVLPF